jgi:hypothetical protein
MPTPVLNFPDRLLRHAVAIERMALAVHLNAKDRQTLASDQALDLYKQVQDLSKALRTMVTACSLPAPEATP